MRDVHEGQARLGLDPLELQLHLPPQAQVEGAQRLVQQEHLGPVDQGPRQRHALLLATAEPGGAAARHTVELDEGERLAGLLGGRGARDPTTARSEGHVVPDAEVRKERVGLEHRVDRALVRPQQCDVPLPQQHPPRVGALEPRHHPQGRRLAAPRGPHEREEAARRHVQGQVVHDHVPPEALGEAVEPQVTGAHCPTTCVHIAAYSCSSRGSRARNTLVRRARKSAVGKISGSSTRSGSTFSMAFCAPATGQM